MDKRSLRTEQVVSRWTVLILSLFPSLLLLACTSRDNPEPDSNKIVVEKRAEPVLSREAGLLADPSVMRVNDELLMLFSDYSLATDSITFNAAKSDDGVNWTLLSQDEGYRVFSGNAASTWDRLIETPELLRVGDQIFLYYIGYPDSNIDSGIYASQIGLAIGSDAETLTRNSDNPILARGGSYDEDALTSPSVIEHAGMYYMVYTGWANILEAGGFLGQLGATSNDGINWQKTNEGIFEEVMGSQFETATESDLVVGPDGLFYLFYTAEGGIALARSANPFGPWELYPDFLLTSTYEWEAGEVVAPSVLIENGKARIWYSGIEGNFTGGSIGYAEIEFPFDWE